MQIPWTIGNLSPAEQHTFFHDPLPRPQDLLAFLQALLLAVHSEGLLPAHGALVLGGDAGTRYLP